MIARGWRIGAVVLAAVLAVVLPAVAGGQTIGGFGRGRAPGRLLREPGISIPKVVNAVNLMIEHRQELALSDTQFAKVIMIKRALDSTNAPLLRKLDSVQRLFRGGPVFSDPSAARRDSLADAHALVQEVIGELAENNGSARDQAYGLLSVQQLDTAQKLEDTAEQAIEEEGKRGKGKGSAPAGPFGRPPVG